MYAIRSYYASFSPVTGEQIGALTPDTPESTKAAIARASEAFKAWRMVPAPKRGELVRLFGEELRASKEALGKLVSIEAGKSPSVITSYSIHYTKLYEARVTTVE